MQPEPSSFSSPGQLVDSFVLVGGLLYNETSGSANVDIAYDSVYKYDQEDEYWSLIGKSMLEEKCCTGVVPIPDDLTYCST